MYLSSIYRKRKSVEKQISFIFFMKIPLRRDFFATRTPTGFQVHP